MIILFFIAFVFLLVFVPFAEFFYSLAKITTLGRYYRFGIMIDWLFEKIQNEKIANFVFNLSFNKAFICVPCHCFWLSLLFFLNLFNPIFALFFALLFYVYAYIRT